MAQRAQVSKRREKSIVQFEWHEIVRNVAKDVDYALDTTRVVVCIEKVGKT